MENSIEKAEQVRDFSKYGIEFNNLGFIGPKKPEKTGQTPHILIEGSNPPDLSEHLDFLQKAFKEESFSLEDNKDEVLKIVNKIFESITGEQLKDFANFIFMNKVDWVEFMKKTHANVEKDKDYSALHSEGLIIVGTTEGENNLFPLLFHEIGHSLYPSGPDNFTDELRAFYFQNICVRIFEEQLNKLGLAVTYGRLETESLPSQAHKDAYLASLGLEGYMLLKEERDNSPYTQRMLKYLEIINKK